MLLIFAAVGGLLQAVYHVDNDNNGRGMAKVEYARRWQALVCLSALAGRRNGQSRRSASAKLPKLLDNLSRPVAEKPSAGTALCESPDSISGFNRTAMEGR